MQMATKPQTDSVTRKRVRWDTVRLNGGVSTFDLDERVMDVDAHGETGEVLEREDRWPERLKGRALKPISIKSLSRPLPAFLRLATNPLLVLILPPMSSARRPLVIWNSHVNA